MAPSIQPTKEQIRQYLAARLTQQSPPPSMTEIRRQLGWGLMAPASCGARRDDPPTDR